MLTWGFILIAMMLSATACTVMLGRRHWQHKTSARRATMRAACRPSSVATYDRREIAVPIGELSGMEGLFFEDHFNILDHFLGVVG